MNPIRNEFTVAVNDENPHIKAFIDSMGCAGLDWQALRTAIDNQPYSTASRDMANYDKAVNGDIKALHKLINDLLVNDFRGKMANMHGIGTSVKLSALCRCKQAINGYICQKCYAEKMTPEMAAKFARSTYVLCTLEISKEMAPFFNFAFFRFEPFSDLINMIQAANYLNMCLKNPHCKFALWTKNPWILFDTINQRFNGKKPKNLQVVYSSPVVNVCRDNVLTMYTLKNGKPMIDKIFTVYTAVYAIENNIAINCGSAVCVVCQICYNKNNVVYINEIEKSEQALYYKLLAKKGGTK